ncbi:MAG TPA: hypothetical protein VKS25_07200, partial [Solirubrobacteraceae bacterium]|nr:hypothetical protein [Solirubrobacteraceae bacterium]
MATSGKSLFDGAARTAWVLLLVLTLASPVAAIALAILIHQTSFSDAGNLAPWLAMSLAFGGVGLVVARREPHNAMGWLLLVVSACMSLVNVAPPYAYLDYTLHEGRLPLGAIAVLLCQSYIYAFMLLP